MKQSIIRKRNYLFEVLCIVEGLVIFLVWFSVMRSVNDALIAAAFTYFPLAWTLRLTLQRHHRAGMHYLKKEDFAEALICFRESEDFFMRYGWVDKYRFITMFASSAYSFREMALHNQAYALIHMNCLQEAIIPLEKLLVLAPGREDAANLLNEIRRLSQE